MMCTQKLSVDGRAQVIAQIEEAVTNADSIHPGFLGIIFPVHSLRTSHAYPLLFHPQPYVYHMNNNIPRYVCFCFLKAKTFVVSFLLAIVTPNFSLLNIIVRLHIPLHNLQLYTLLVPNFAYSRVYSISWYLALYIQFNCSLLVAHLHHHRKVFPSGYFVTKPVLITRHIFISKYGVSRLTGLF
jgi:hypothetical protein